MRSKLKNYILYDEIRFWKFYILYDEIRFWKFCEIVLRWEYFFYVKRKIFSRNIPPGSNCFVCAICATYICCAPRTCETTRYPPPTVHATQTKERADWNNLIGSLAVVHLPKSAGLDFSTLKYKSMRKYAKIMNIQFFLKKRSFVQYSKSRRKKKKSLLLRVGASMIYACGWWITRRTEPDSSGG